MDEKIISLKNHLEKQSVDNTGDSNADWLEPYMEIKWFSNGYINLAK